MAARTLLRAMLAPAAALALFACGGSKTAPAASGPAPAAASASVAAPAPASAAVAGGLPAGVTAQMVAAGDSLFNAPRNCNGCHGKGGLGGRGGPDLTTAKHMHVDGSYASFVRIITDGVPRDSIRVPTHRFPMRPRGGHDFSDAQIRDLAAYVWTLSHKP